MIDLNKFWQFFINKMKENFSEVAFNAWFKNTKPIAFDPDTKEMTVTVESAISKGYWEKNLATQLIQEAYAFANLEINPVFVVKGESSSERYVIPQAHPEPAKKKTAPISRDLHLNNSYTFDTFVQGEGNKLAASAALAAAEKPGSIYNPLFIFGGVGLGKTHLMQAIGHQRLQEKPDARVVYIQSETFVNDFINSIKNKTQDQFRDKYRKADLLLVDDIQFFAKKEGIQEEFFHTFETLYNNKKQIVMTSDRLPNEIPDLSERLVSRFAWGLQVEITPPDLETRIAILRKKAEGYGLEIDNTTLDYIASQVDTNIRELEGALVKVQAHATIERKDISVGLAREALADLKLVQKDRGIQISRIQEVVANYFQTSVEDLKGKKRVKQIVVPRQIAMYLSRELTDASLPKIGQEFGGKDHTTVMHAHSKIAKAIKTDTEIKSSVTDLKEIIER
ncbi:MAG: chromosomal replication initiator protein DnaA [Lactobacillus sp.]|nr:chromosomal replication initiator protein DnaA [Lactobacillus sp.]MCH3990775.1 chromosomal replication initiator protein DnaA [Lactobacillus sp.]MCH4068509.1 chromosomal replication initiator protein DnaA [Lactobacillus sp.]MCI1304258.1 chromosomal replication initiator protein DnaA [Lactobacillus sp.]MCI1330441.1 chromosomal replication initiator protein DnaA [Lactobacillus sp.]